MSLALYLSHPEIVVDPDIPVPQWSLSETGRSRATLFGHRLRGAGLSRIITSTETKAVETAGIIGGLLGIPVAEGRDMGENDRSATGFVPPGRFEALADAFFAAPEISVMGWERAIDAQARIVGAIDAALHAHGSDTSVLFVGHGGVGTLLRCALAGIPIDHRHDQKGQGNVFAFTLVSRRVLCEWTPIEKWERSQWPEI